jgi:D-sedoheptulose 7-phosphate isomerase
MNDFFVAYPQLAGLKPQIEEAVNAICRCFGGGGKMLLCGNGGSAADCEHIAGELLKGFKLRREISQEYKTRLSGCGDMCDKLQMGLPAISLVSNASIMTAVINDIGGDMVFAQQVFALAKKGDVLVAISTSGNSQSVYNAALVAKALGCIVTALTGDSGGKLKAVADILINVPDSETYKVQHLHQPVYHYICARVENNFFGGKNADSGI